MNLALSIHFQLERAISRCAPKRVHRVHDFSTAENLPHNSGLWPLGEYIFSDSASFRFSHKIMIQSFREYGEGKQLGVLRMRKLRQIGSAEQQRAVFGNLEKRLPSIPCKYGVMIPRTRLNFQWQTVVKPNSVHAFYASPFKVNVAPEVVGVLFVLHAPHRLQRYGIVRGTTPVEATNTLSGYGSPELLQGRIITEAQEHGRIACLACYAWLTLRTLPQDATDHASAITRNMWQHIVSQVHIPVQQGKTLTLSAALRRRGELQGTFFVHLQLAVREVEDGACLSAQENGISDFALGEPKVQERLSGGGHTLVHRESLLAQYETCGLPTSVEQV